jgi:hypothetical protein
VNLLVDRLQTLQQLLCQPNGPCPGAMTNQREIHSLIRAIERKRRMAEIHLCVLRGIDWDRVDGLGRRMTKAGTADSLCVSLPEARLHLEHPMAAIDHVYLAFDGLTACLVNMTDTLARLLRLTYNLDLDERRTTLFSVREICASDSTLGIMLSDPQNTAWLKKVRELRGRCQHRDVEEILISQSAPYGRRGQPVVDQSYSWRTPPEQIPIVFYASEAAEAARVCILAVIDAVHVCPSNPTERP